MIKNKLTGIELESSGLKVGDLYDNDNPLVYPGYRADRGETEIERVRGGELLTLTRRTSSHWNSGVQLWWITPTPPCSCNRNPPITDN